MAARRSAERDPHPERDTKKGRFITWQLGAGPLPALGELARHLAYGLAIGSTFPILVPCSRSRAAA
jgi:hypothetical protein